MAFYGIGFTTWTGNTGSPRLDVFDERLNNFGLDLHVALTASWVIQSSYQHGFIKSLRKGGFPSSQLGIHWLIDHVFGWIWWTRKPHTTSPHRHRVTGRDRPGPMGFNSKELSVLAATIERLVRDEADMLLNVHWVAKWWDHLGW